MRGEKNVRRADLACISGYAEPHQHLLLWLFVGRGAVPALPGQGVLILFPASGTQRSLTHLIYNEPCAVRGVYAASKKNEHTPLHVAVVASVYWIP
jgi:hypothetical protein